MIHAVITSDRYKIKTCRKVESLKSIRVIIPKGWDCDMVNIVLWEDDICDLKFSNPEKYEFTIPNCGEIFLKNVIKDEQRHYVYIPTHYDGQQVLIVPV